MKLKIYRIFSFLLLPMAVLFTITVMLFLRAAFANPAMFFPLFLIACIAIYSFTSLSFLIKGIDGKKELNRSLRDWIRVNAFVSIIFALLMITQSIIFLVNPAILSDLAAQAKENAGQDLKINVEVFERYLRITSYFFLVYAVVLFVHIIMSFQYLRTYNYLFRNEKTGLPE